MSSDTSGWRATNTTLRKLLLPAAAAAAAHAELEAHAIAPPASQPPNVVPALITPPPEQLEPLE